MGRARDDHGFSLFVAEGSEWGAVRASMKRRLQLLVPLIRACRRIDGALVLEVATFPGRRWPTRSVQLPPEDLRWLARLGVAWEVAAYASSGRRRGTAAYSSRRARVALLAFALLGVLPRGAEAQTRACEIRHDLRALPNLLAPATESYVSRHSRRPSTVQDLVDDGRLRAVPVDPYGKPYTIDLRPDGSWVVALSEGRAPPTAWDCFASERSTSELPGASAMLGAVGLAVLARRSKTRKRWLWLFAFAATLFVAGLLHWSEFGILY